MKWLIWLVLAVAAWQGYAHLNEARRPAVPDAEASLHATTPAPLPRRVTNPARTGFT